MRTVLANGCFDLLHPGHVTHLVAASEMGDRLIVGLTRDECVGKRGRPIQTWNDRATMLEALRCVSDVFPCDNAVQAILEKRPDVFVKGMDYAEIGLLEEEIAICAEVGAEIRFTETPKFGTTQLIELIHRKLSERDKRMWEETDNSPPPKHEVLAVVHRIKGGEQMHEDAIWDGEYWTKRGDTEKLDKNYYFLWRRLEV